MQEGLLPYDLQRAVVVTVVSMGVVQASIHQVVNVITVGDCLMPATGAMDVAVCMGGTVCAAAGVAIADINAVLVHMITVGMMQVAIVQVINMIAVFYCNMATAGAVFVIMILMNVAA